MFILSTLTFDLDITFVLDAMIFHSFYPLLFVNSIYVQKVVFGLQTFL